MKAGNKEYIKDKSRPFGNDTHLISQILDQMSTEPALGIQLICEKSNCVFTVESSAGVHIENEVNPVPIDESDLITVVGSSIKDLAKKLDDIIIEKVQAWTADLDTLELDTSNQVTIRTCLRSSYTQILRNIGRAIQPQDLTVIGPSKVIDLIPQENKKVILKSDRTIVTHGAQSNPFMSPIILAVKNVGVSHRDFGFRGAIKLMDPDVHFCVMENVKDPIYKEEEDELRRITEDNQTTDNG